MTHANLSTIQPREYTYRDGWYRERLHVDARAQFEVDLFWAPTAAQAHVAQAMAGMLRAVRYDWSMRDERS